MLVLLKKPSFDTFIQLPIGLVPKNKGKKTRLIFHLSYPRDGDSVNSGIPRDKCTVKYPDFADAVRMCLRAGKFAKMGKSDMAMAFRQVPLRVQNFRLLLLKCEHPITGKTYYWVDKCLPFGSAISCAIFQAISNSIAYLVKIRIHDLTLAYLDDYFFVTLLKKICDWHVNTFIQVCKDISFPISLEKTYWGSTLLIFLGFLLDTERQIISVPVDKVEKALYLIQHMLCKKKGTVKQIQKLAGFLNFLCRCIVPSQAFTRRLYALTSGCGKLKPYHHINLRQENRLDLLMWQRFLSSANIFSRFC